MAKISEIYKSKQSEKLFEARVNLLQKGIYPFDVFLKEHAETIKAAEQIEKLEEVVNAYSNKLPTLYLFVKQNTETLMESKTNVHAVQSALVNYAFISESIATCVAGAVKVLKTKHSAKTSLKSIYGSDAVQLLEFCISRSESGKLMEGNTKPVIKLLANELSSLPLGELTSLCENIPKINLYISNTLHKELAKVIAG